MSAHFTIDANQVGGRIIVDGQDVSTQVAAADLRVGTTEPTVLSLHLTAVGRIEGDGIVQVIADPADEADTICAFLAQIDPDQLEQDALMVPGPAGTLTAPMLQVLAGYARGVAP